MSARARTGRRRRRWSRGRLRSGRGGILVVGGRRGRIVVAGCGGRIVVGRGRGFRRGILWGSRGRFRFFLRGRTRTRTKRPRAIDYTRVQATSQRSEDTLGEIEATIRTARALIHDSGGNGFAVIGDGDRGPTILRGTRDIPKLSRIQRDDVGT